MLRINLLFFLLIPLLANSQTNLDSDRISELYDLIQDQSKLFGTEVLIYDYKLKGKKTITDSTLVARIDVVDNQDLPKTFEYDTSGLVVIKYELTATGRVPVLKLTHDAKMRVIESTNVDENLEDLSKTFYKYENDQLLGEESYTGYSYLENPRNFSRIDYKYKSGKLIEKNKKYSLNGTHWIQTWLTKYDEKGNMTQMVETNGDITQNQTFIYNDKMQLVKCLIKHSEQKPSVKEITYTASGHPKSIYLYSEKRNKPLRLTKFFYKKK